MSSTLPCWFLLIGSLLPGLVRLGWTAEVPALRLPEFRFEDVSWRYARWGEIEVFTLATEGRTRELVAALERGRRIYPDFFTAGLRLPMLLVVVDDPNRTLAGLVPEEAQPSDGRRWPEQSEEFPGIRHWVDDDGQVTALNVGRISRLWPILMDRGHGLVSRQRPPFPPWVLGGLMGDDGIFSSVQGVRHTISVRLHHLVWPDPAVATGRFPPDAVALPEFAVMFDPTRDSDHMVEGERRRFLFQAAWFARWSLFGPVKNGRNRNGYWAFAAFARRGPVTEELFRQCYGMSWAQACGEMQAYLKSKAVDLIEVRLPHIMTGIPEADQLEFVDATPAQVQAMLRRLRQGPIPAGLQSEDLSNQTNRREQRAASDPHPNQ